MVNGGHNLFVGQPAEHGRDDFQRRFIGNAFAAHKIGLDALFLEPFGDHAAAAVNYHQRFTLFLEGDDVFQNRVALPKGRAAYFDDDWFFHS